MKIVGARGQETMVSVKAKVLVLTDALKVTSLRAVPTVGATMVAILLDVVLGSTPKAMASHDLKKTLPCMPIGVDLGSGGIYVHCHGVSIGRGRRKCRGITSILVDVPHGEVSFGGCGDGFIKIGWWFNKGCKC